MSNILIRKLKWYIKQTLVTPLRLLPLQRKKIVFSNFSGRGFGDNPKYIAETLLNKGYDLVWLQSNLDEQLPKGIRAIRYNSLRAYYELATAKVWVDNVRNSSRPTKRKGQVYLQTWHGSFAPKLCEENAEFTLDPFYVWLAKYDGKICDAILMGDDLQFKTIGEHMWLGPQASILKFGLPRNDLFFNLEKVNDIKQKLQERFGANKQQIVVLYMPTFRDDDRHDGYIQDFQSVQQAFEERFGRPVIMLVKYHPNVKFNGLDLTFSDAILNVTDYPDSQELYCVADFLISDYSSAPTDFSLLGKPVILTAFDVEAYRASRGLLDEYELLPYPRALDMKNLLDIIRSFNYQSYRDKITEFSAMFHSYEQGTATRNIVDWIETKIMNT